MVSNHRAEFRCHRHCGKGEIMVLVSQMIMQGHVVKGQSDFLSGSFLW